MKSKSTLTRRELLTAGASALVGTHPLGAVAQERSTQALRLIVPFTAGGLTDVLARSAGESMVRHVGQPVIVENRPGASGHIAADLVARGPSDGSQMAMLSAGHAGGIAYATQPVRYDLLKDFTAIGMLGFSPTILVARQALNVRDFPGLVALARSRPGQLTFAAVQNYTVEYLQVMAGVEFNMILYKGAAAAYQDMLAERVDLMVGTAADMARLVDTGKFVPVAVNSPKRLPEFPGVAPVAEMIPGYRAGQWYGLFVPAAVPRPVVDRLRAALARSVKEPAYLAALSKLSMTAPDLDVEAFTQEVAETLQSFQRARRTGKPATGTTG
jgi:tripartite-type tricarboxylate transporter receptor subunit TctC